GADAQRAGGDVRRSRSRRIGGVVGRIGAGDRNTVYIDGPGGADVLAGKAGVGIAGSEVVAGNPVVGQGDGCAGRAVIRFIGSGGADAQSAGGDVGGGGACVRGQLIVAGISTAQAQAGDSDGLAQGRCFGGEAGGAAAQADVVAATHVVEG